MLLIKLEANQKNPALWQGCMSLKVLLFFLQLLLVYLFELLLYVNQGSYIDNLSDKNMNIEQQVPSQHLYGSSGGFAPNSQMYYEPYEMPPQKDTLNCRDVAGHASNCDVCSKLYKNDKTFYIIAICILVIICILLFKRILDV